MRKHFKGHKILKEQIQKLLLITLTLFILVSIGCGGGGGGGNGDGNRDEVVSNDGNNNSPVAQIITPSAESIFNIDDEIQFTGTGNDAEDGELSGISLVWSSDIDGQIGTGGTCSIDFLGAGTHDITLTATDLGALTGMDTISITINQTDTSAAGKLPDTSQITSYTDTFGEDSDYIINPKSYTKLDESGNELSDSATQWGMVRDNVTGLIWANKKDDGSLHDKDKNYPWHRVEDRFIAQLNAESFGGCNNWRVPTVKELSSLVDADSPSPGPTIDTNYFQNVQDSEYWSSTPRRNSTMRWAVNFRNGHVSYIWESYYHYVFAGQGSQTENNLVDNGDGTVTDQQSGLMWQQSETDEMTWEEALQYCEDLELAGYSDWRLPNRNELQSIVDYSELFTRPIDTVAFPGAIGRDHYWSSTSHATYQNSAWRIYFGYQGGGVSYRAKFDSYSSYVRAVRTVQR